MAHKIILVAHPCSSRWGCSPRLVVMRLWSAVDFIPKALAFERANPSTITEAAARRWSRRSMGRLPLDLVTCGAMLTAVVTTARARRTHAPGLRHASTSVATLARPERPRFRPGRLNYFLAACRSAPSLNDVPLEGQPIARQYAEPVPLIH